MVDGERFKIEGNVLRMGNKFSWRTRSNEQSVTTESAEAYGTQNVYEIFWFQ